MTTLPTNQRISITGHRVEDIPDIVGLREALKEILYNAAPTAFIQGMANGVDLNSGVVAIKQGIPTFSVKPWAGHSARQEDEYMYDWVWRKSSQTHVVDSVQNYPGPWVYHKRNEYMVDNADIVLSVWSGKKKGGTYACSRYAQSVGKPIYWLNPITFEFAELKDKI